MKKTLSIILCMTAVLTLFSFVSCSAGTRAYKLGIGVKQTLETPTDATKNKNGKGTLVTTAAAVLLDRDGKIVKCVIDTSEAVAEYTSDGKYIPSSENKTKYELGADYGMKEYGGAAKEWFEQIDALTSAVVGKTVEDVRKLGNTAGEPSDELVGAGCTVNVSDFIYAIDKAISSATDVEANKKDTLKLKMSVSQTGKDATKDENGHNTMTCSITLDLTDKDGNKQKTLSQETKGSFVFDSEGKIKE